MLVLITKWYPETTEDDDEETDDLEEEKMETASNSENKPKVGKKQEKTSKRKPKPKVDPDFEYVPTDEQSDSGRIWCPCWCFVGDVL